ncbi:MAG: M6 family metalloprotease domain-containing protein [bacterium]|nr:M6 family metalloprotease domain-containing protein [bacterium]
MRRMFDLGTTGLVLCAMLLAVGCLAGQARADAVSGEEFTLPQPDGTSVTVRIWGDEFYRVVESLDGYTLVRDPFSGVGCYARLSADGSELVSTGVAAAAAKPADLDVASHLRINRESAHAKIAAAQARQDKQRDEVLAAIPGGRGLRGVPSTGNVQGITLLVDFSDDPWTIPASGIDNYCNQIGYSGYGNNGSVRDYFYEVSDGNLTYTNYVPTAYYRASLPKSWYEDPDYSRARDLVLEALNALDAGGFDFSQYDSNGDGIIDAVNLFYAGPCNNLWSEGLWPHSGWISFNRDGVSTERYQMTDIGWSLQLRTFCHENGHMICYWPDLYDYGYESTGVGNFCLMCFGASNTNPCEPCAYMKEDAGWTNTIQLTTGQTGLGVTAGVNTVYKYLRPGSTTEYYMVENRQKSGRDLNIPDRGVAIWHVDENGNNDYEQMTPQYHYQVTLVQADGDWDLENNRNYGDSADLWAAPSYTECTPQTNPNTGWWSGAASGAYFRDISSSAATMTFTFSFVAFDCNANDIEDACDIDCGAPGCTPLCGGSDDCNSNAVPDECEPQDDCQPNGFLDICDIAGGTSLDCQGDGTPDDCQLAGNDCNNNTIPDECELAGNDCNENESPDECDIDFGTSVDCQTNGIPDECESDCNGNLYADECDLAGGTSADCNTNGRPDECDVTRCTSLWDGFLPNPPFSRNRLMNTIDYVPWPEGDGVYWDNPEGTAIVDRRGCETGASSDQTVKVSVDAGLVDSTDGYLASEYFQPYDGVLAPAEEIYALSFSFKIGLGIDSKWDWEFFVMDAEGAGRAVTQLEFVSYASLEDDVDPGYIMIRNPEWPVGPKFLSTGVTLMLDACYDVEVELNNLNDTVSVYVDGDLKVVTTRLDANARRMDYFSVQPASNGATTGSTTDIKLDAFALCRTGLGVSPAEFPDCNGNDVLDDCDIADGTSVDCNSNGIPDECDTLDFGDFDFDGDVDWTDHQVFQSCFTGVCTAPPCDPALYSGPCCVIGDTNNDGDIDLGDFGAFQEAFDGL